MIRAVAIAALLWPAAAAAAPRRADLSVASARLTGTPAAGARLKLRVTVRNTGTAAAAASQVSAGVAKQLTRARVPKLRRGGRATVTLTLAFPTAIAPGRYGIVVCADAAQEDQGAAARPTTAARCSQALIVASPVRRPRRCRRPVPQPRAGAERDRRPRPPTPTPTPTPVATAPPTGEVPPEDLPPLIPSFDAKIEAISTGQGVATGAIADTRAGIVHGRAQQANGQPARGREGARSTTTLSSARRRSAADGTLPARGQRRGEDHARLSQATATSRSSATSIPTQLDFSNAARRQADRPRPGGRRPRTRPPPAAGPSPAARRTADRDGTRASTLLFAPGTTATMRLADGSSRPLPAPWTVRQTEYTAVGPAAMPGDLPPTSGYTYAAELSIDEAETAGADLGRARRPPIRRPAGRQLRRGLHRRARRQRRADRRLRPPRRSLERLAPTAVS